MREIKFRAWNITQNKMEIPFSIYDIKDDYWDNNTKNKIFLQFTGLLDKNGKEIYEGDIVEHIPKFQTKYEIKYLTSGFYICPIGRNYGEYFQTLFAGFDENRSQCNSLEIIGNIYENPDLLSKPQ